jgi:hypothetical protein
MSECPACHQPNVDTARFCKHCGHTLTIGGQDDSSVNGPAPLIFCACGAENRSGSKFCKHCGEPLAAETGATTPTRTPEAATAPEQAPTPAPEPVAMPEPVVLPDPKTVPEPVVLPEPETVQESVVLPEPVAVTPTAFEPIPADTPVPAGFTPGLATGQTARQAGQARFETELSALAVLGKGDNTQRRKRLYVIIGLSMTVALVIAGALFSVLSTTRPAVHASPTASDSKSTQPAMILAPSTHIVEQASQPLSAAPPVQHIAAPVAASMPTPAHIDASRTVSETPTISSEPVHTAKVRKPRPPHKHTTGQSLGGGNQYEDIVLKKKALEKELNQVMGDQ